eukprot:GFUD01040107.1.p1 GENE.GFUD01040107.1~~GFUD01040107.1.p1  ORF type:complete len:249 (+),score=59.05 GFUD01040107.1:116-862(+)
MDVISQHDFTLLRAKTYSNTVMVNKKKNYRCHYCTFLNPIFTNLKLHIKENHLEEGINSAPSSGISKSRRSSCSPPKVARAKLDTQPTMEEQLVKVTVFKNSFYCQECNFRTKYKTSIVSHLGSKKHVDNKVIDEQSWAMESLTRSQSKSAMSKSPLKARSRKRKSVSKTSHSAQKSKLRSQSSKSQSPSSPKDPQQPGPIPSNNLPTDVKSKSPEKSRSKSKKVGIKKIPQCSKVQAAIPIQKIPKS